MLVTGPNGAGKTNLLESLHVGTQGFSPRTRADAQLVRTGADAARVALTGRTRRAAAALEVTLQQTGKRAKLNGAPLRAAEQLRSEVATLVFTPDRLAVVKGGPAARRAYFDRSLARLLPGRSSLPVEYAAAVGQRNAALRRVGAASRRATPSRRGPSRSRRSPRRSSRRGGRRSRCSQPAFAARADELGLPAAALDYSAEPPTVADLEARLDRDLERGTTGLGPHLDDVTIRLGRPRPARSTARRASSGWRCWRCSSPRQRRSPSAAVLPRSSSSTTCSPSSTRRAGARLAARIAGMGQTVVTATGADALPLEPAQLLEVTPGAVTVG